MTVTQGTYQRCLQYAAARGESMIKGMVEAARHSIGERIGATTDPRRRDHLKDALRLLNRHETFLCRHFPGVLLEEFSSKPLPAAPEAQARNRLSFDQLELMDDLQVQERVEIARIQQAALLAAELELKDLNRMICGAQGLQNVLADRNPMRPETYARALRAVLAQTEVEPSVRLVWMHEMSTVLGEALAATYQDLSRMLREAGVEPATYLVTQATGGARVFEVAKRVSLGADLRGAVQRSMLHESGAAVMSGHAEKLLTLGYLRRLLAGELDDARVAPGPVAVNEIAPVPHPPEFSHTVPAAFEALHEMKQVDTVIERLSSRRRDPPSGMRLDEGAGGADAGLRQSMGDNARSMGQALGQEVVSLMVDNIASDARLLAPVREVVKTLEPALFRLVLKDPRFFSHREHPARALLEEITQRSLGFDDVEAEGFKTFMRPVQSAVEMLASLPVDGPQPFAVALQAVRDDWASHTAREQARRDKALQVLLHAEQRNLLAERISRDLGELPEMKRVDPAVAGLLTGPWSLVMAQARLRRPAEGNDPGGYGALASDLLWSAQPELTKSDRNRLVRMVPGLIRTLREGLESIDFPAARTSEFLDILMGLHQQALQPAAPPKLSLEGIALSRSALEACFEQSDKAGVWLVGQEARDSGFFDPPPSRPDSGPPFAPTQPMERRPGQPAPPMPVEEDEDFIALTQPGDWVDLWVRDKWLRSQLTWASPQGKLFMFTSVSGEAHSMTRRALHRLYDEGGVRVIATQALVDGALDAVAQTALQNSMDINL